MNAPIASCAGLGNAIVPKHGRMILLSLALLLGLLPRVRAQAVIDLGNAASFAVLGSTTVTSTGATIVNGDFGVSPGLSYTGFPPGVVLNGAIHVGDTTASTARADALTAYNVLTGESFTQDLTGLDLGSRTLSPGVYFYNAAAQLTGTLILDAANNSNARFDFQIGTTLGTAIGSNVLLINGAQAANVFWQVGSSATLLGSTAFEGNLLASASITANTGTTINGRLFALNGAVTLDSNTISVPSAIPEPATNALIAAVTVLGVALWHRRRAARGVYFSGRPGPARHLPDLS